MRAIFLILSLCGILNAASCPNYSSVTALSGFIPAYAALESAGNGYIKDIENYWSSDIKGILDSIKQEIEKKEKLLTQIKNLKKESLLLNKKNRVFIK